MEVDDFGGSHKVNSDQDLDEILAARYGQGVNEFWLWQGDKLRPAICIFANGELACIHYYPHDDHPGFQSLGPAPGLDSKGETMFFVNSPEGEETPMPNTSVVPFSWARAVAKEFARSTQLPRCIKWSEL
jgi:hypothetical protein